MPHIIVMVCINYIYQNQYLISDCSPNCSIVLVSTLHISKWTCITFDFLGMNYKNCIYWNCFYISEYSCNCNIVLVSKPHISKSTSIILSLLRIVCMNCIYRNHLFIPKGSYNCILSWPANYIYWNEFALCLIRKG